MARVHIDMSDFVRLGAELQAAPEVALERLGVAVDKTCADIKADAQRAAPVDTGNLRSSMTHETKRTSSGASGVVTAGAEYAPFVEYGTSTMAPQPFLGPAFDRHSGPFVDAVEQIVGDL